MSQLLFIAGVVLGVLALLALTGTLAIGNWLVLLVIGLALVVLSLVVGRVH